MTSPVNVRRDGDNVLRTRVVPIVFVPGVMGSRLRFPTLDERWNPDSSWDMWHWLRIGAERARREFALNTPAVVMDTNDADDTITQAQLGRGWGGVAWSFYGQFVRDLDGQRFAGARTPVYVVGYDWRQNNRDSGDAVAARIDEILAQEGASTFILISHSMGGLVTRAMLKNNAGVAGKLLGVAHVAQPAAGAAVLYRRMFSGALSSLDGGWAFANVLGNNRVKFQIIISAMPGPMQLMPTPHYRDTDATWWLSYTTFEHPDQRRSWEGVSWDLFDQPASPPGVLAPNNTPGAIPAVPRRELAARLREARAFHDWLGLYKHDKTWAIYSTGLEVDMRVHFALPPLRTRIQPPIGRHHQPLVYGQRGDGSWDYIRPRDAAPADRGVRPQRRSESDGTVPDSSAEVLFPGQRHPVAIGEDYDAKRQFQISGSAHDAICHAADCETFLFDLIRHLLGS